MTLLNLSVKDIIGAPVGLPPFIPTTPVLAPVRRRVEPPAPEIPGAGLPRALTYLADYGGCSFYRCMGPDMLLNLHQKAVIIESTTMALDPNFYTNTKAVKVQRQATPQQKMFIDHLKGISKEKGFKMIYEIDDVVFAEDIPIYNRNRDAFTPPEIQKSIREILAQMDEIIVTCDYFKEYMISKTGNPNVSVVPNYLMKWWFDRYYNLGNLIKNFEKNKKKPVVAIFASGTHVDVLNRADQQDDFAHVVNHIIKYRKEFKWKFYGSHPLALRPYIQSGEIEFVNWVPLADFPQAMAESGAQVTFAALQENHFNFCKSNIKLIEAGALGLPCVCPDMATYKDAELKYKNGQEFIDLLKEVTRNQTVYANHCKWARSHADKFWLDDEPNLMKHHEVYFTPFDSSERKYLK